MDIATRFWTLQLHPVLRSNAAPLYNRAGPFRSVEVWGGSTMHRFLGLVALLFLLGCQANGQFRQSYRIPTPSRQPPVGVVFLANGAGDSRSVTHSLSQVLEYASPTLEVKTFAWSHGYWRVIFDQLDHTNHLDQAHNLAVQICAYRSAHPDRRVYLLGHSAGSAVVLAAAEALPPNSVTRIILLAPSVCATYDLRPALRASREGIDCFYSDADRLILGLGVGILGTTEGGCRTPAGRVGFIPAQEDPADARLYEKLRQHPWDPEVRWTGHDGGHFGNHVPDFLRVYVLPLLGCRTIQSRGVSYPG